MATANPISRLQPLPGQRRFLAWGLLWASLVLMIMAHWLRLKYQQLPAFMLWGLVLLSATAAVLWLLLFIRVPMTPERMEAAKSNFGPALFAAGLFLIAAGVWLIFGIGLQTLDAGWGLGLLSLAAFSLWVLVLFPIPTTPERAEADKRQVGIVLIVAGIALIPAALWLLFSYRLQGLGESLGLATLALIALGTGTRLASAPPTVSFQDRFLRGLIDTRAAVSMLLLLLGGALGILGFWLRFSHQGTTEDPLLDFPLWLGPILFGLLFLGVGMYLRLTPELSLPQARMIVLLAGGGFGLLLALLTVCQAWIWRPVFFGGLPAWRGPQAWQLWLCAYLELVGLVLMFVCLNLARADVRANPVLRRALYGYNAVLMGLLLAVLLVVLNIIVFVAYPLTFNWSEKGGLYSLSPKSIDILEKLEQPAKVYVILAPQTRLYKEVRYLLNNAQALTDKLEVETIAPDRDEPKYRDLVSKFPELIPDQFGSGRGILLLYGAETKEAPHKFIGQDKLVESVNPMRRGSETFVGEKALMSELQFLMTEKKKSKVYFLQGDGEMSLKGGRFNFRPEARVEMSALGLSKLVDRLRGENIEVSGLGFGTPDKKDDQIVYAQESGEQKRKEVPEDARVVVIAGPSAPIPKETVEALERYLEGKGKLIVLVDVVTDNAYTQFKATGLDEFLKKYGVEIPNKYVHSFGNVRRDPRSGLIVPIYDRGPTQVYAFTGQEAHSALAKKFSTETFTLTTARVVKPGGVPGKYQAEVLLEVPPARELQENLWAEDAPALRDPNKFNVDAWNRKEVERKRSREPIPVAVTVSEAGGKPRMVVFGDAEWISDLSLTKGTETPPDVYYSLFASAIDWLSERPGLGIRPREPGIYVMKTDVAKESSRLVLLPGWILVLGTLGVGLGVWVVRRR